MASGKDMRCLEGAGKRLYIFYKASLTTVKIWHQRVGDVPAEELLGILRRNQVAELLGLHHQVGKAIELVHLLFGQLRENIFLQELVQKILLLYVSSVAQFFLTSSPPIRLAQGRLRRGSFMLVFHVECST